MYTKKDSIMTKGYAILCMLMLHLFCRVGTDVYGTPLIWINKTTPLVYLFGFFANICVPLYSICAGYAQYLIMENGNLNKKSKTKRVLNILINYWIVLFTFCALGIIFSHESIPGNPVYFIKSIFLLHSYNGAWWYLNTYILLLLLPSFILLFPIKKIKNPTIGLLIFLGIDICRYFLYRFGIICDLEKNSSVINFITQEILNLIYVLPFFWIGALFCKFKTIDFAKNKLDRFVSQKYQKVTLVAAGVITFLIATILNKVVIMGTISIIAFLNFNLVKKSNFTEHILMFLGKHSTNIWLTHMFFYMVLFNGLVQSVKYPLLMLFFMLTLCILSSYIIMFIQTALFTLFDKIKQSRNNL
jgi:hypothetical protein